MLLIGAGQTVSAHTMWMELGPATQENIQTVNVFFGEFGDEKATPYAKWFSNLKDVAVFVENPDGKVVQLTNGIPAEDHLTFQFTTEKDGLYKVYFEHEVKDVFKGMKITYSSAVLYGKNYTKSGKVGFYGIDLAFKKISVGQFVYTVNGTPLAEATVTAAAKGNKGNDITLTADKKGKITLDKNVKGDFLLEVVDKKDVTEKSHLGKEYGVDYKMFTYKIVLQ